MSGALVCGFCPVMDIESITYGLNVSGVTTTESRNNHGPMTAYELLWYIFDIMIIEVHDFFSFLSVGNRPSPRNALLWLWVPRRCW